MTWLERAPGFLSSLAGHTRRLALSDNGPPGPETEAAPPSDLVDIHAHILPELDDGPACMDDAVALCRALVAQGVVTAVATPHQSGLYPRNTNTAIRTAVGRLREALAAHDVSLEVVPGADIRIDADLMQRVRAQEVMALGDRKGYILLELPHEVAFPLTDLIVELRAEGSIPILSHPERNVAVVRRPECLCEWVQAGLLLQVTMDSLLGAAGKPAQRTARRIVEQGLCAVLAGDVHSVDQRPPRHADAWTEVASRWGTLAARRLMADVPARIVGGGREAQGEYPPWETARCPFG